MAPGIGRQDVSAQSHTSGLVVLRPDALVSQYLARKGGTDTVL